MKADPIESLEYFQARVFHLCSLVAVSIEADQGRCTYTTLQLPMQAVAAEAELSEGAANKKAKK